MNNYSASFFLLLTLLGTSCVSQKKYLLEFQGRQECLEREQQLEQEIQVYQEQMESYNMRIAYKDGQIQGLNEEINRMEARNQQLNLELDRIINDATSNQEKMEMALQTRVEDLAEKERIISELKETVRQSDDAMSELLNRLENALQKYTADELIIDMKNGRVHVALFDRLLFLSGGYEINNRGREALGLLAGALMDDPNLNITVEGHTDNIPIKVGVLKDNWDLSVLRATSVVRLLTENQGLSPEQVTPAGRGEFDPVAPNETREGRAFNRRTEIIIEPKMEALFGLIRKGEFCN